MQSEITFLRFVQNTMFSDATLSTSQVVLVAVETRIYFAAVISDRQS